MLYKVVLSRTMFRSVSQQFFHHVKLMVSWEDNLHALLLILLYLTIRCFIDADALFFLSGDIALQDAE